ncbi:YwqI/YxiC family protein [Metabacillus sp. JX24]|uniref:YwqI/YxiC family protein n=1 Tax=Metabacillus sp. JX24 TaxID=3240759 RepID=UPI00350F7570
MTQIKLNHAEMIGKLNEVRRALEALTLDVPGEAGENKLDFTQKWLDREAALHQFVAQYTAVVQKNLEDTRANLDMLKEQDEAIVRR